MLEFIFFNKKTSTLFEKYAASLGIEPIIEKDDESYLVRLTEDSDEVLLEKLEAYYDELLDMDRELAEEHEDPENDINTAGIAVQLRDGRTVYAGVSPELINRVMQNISSEELNILICAIVDAVENPDERSLCQR